MQFKISLYVKPLSFVVVNGTIAGGRTEGWVNPLQALTSSDYWTRIFSGVWNITFIYLLRTHTKFCFHHFSCQLLLSFTPTFRVIVFAVIPSYRYNMLSTLTNRVWILKNLNEFFGHI